jgi:protein-disulfide isomerase
VRSSPWLPRLALGALAIVLGYAIVSLSVGEGGPEKVTITGVEDTQQLYGGIEQDGVALGSNDATTSISVFTDLQCTPCAGYQVDTIDPLVEEYARTDKARLEFRNLSFGGAETTLAAHGAAAAGEQGHEWQFADIFFRNQDEVRSSRVTEGFLNDIAAAVPELAFEQWSQDRDSAAVAAQVDADAKLADDLHLPTNAPSVVVSGPAATTQLTDSPSKQEIEAAVAAASG